MAVHSFKSIGEIQEAKTDAEREMIRAKVLEESRTFDTYVRKAVQNNNAEARKNALLDLESLHEFKRSHPTVEVRHISWPLASYSTFIACIPTNSNPRLAFHSTLSSGWGSRRCKSRAFGNGCCRAWNVISKPAIQLAH